MAPIAFGIFIQFRLLMDDDTTRFSLNGSQQVMMWYRLGQAIGLLTGALWSKFLNIVKKLGPFINSLLGRSGAIFQKKIIIFWMKMVINIHFYKSFVGQYELFYDLECRNASLFLDKIWNFRTQWGAGEPFSQDGQMLRAGCPRPGF